MADSNSNNAAGESAPEESTQTQPTQPTQHATQTSDTTDSAPTTTTTQQATQSDQPPPPDASLDADIEADMLNPTPSQPQPPADSMNLDGGNDAPRSNNISFDPSSSTATATSLPQPATIPEPRLPAKKDASLREFLSKMDDHAPLIPDAVTSYYLTLAGLPPPPETPLPLARLLALATQKFVADIAADAYQYSRIRSTNTTSNNPLTGLGGAAGFGAGMGAGGGGGDGDGAGGKKGGKDAGKNAPLGGPRAGFGGGGAGGGAGQGRTVLTMEDLGMAVGEYGVNVKRGEFYR